MVIIHFITPVLASATNSRKVCFAVLRGPVKTISLFFIMSCFFLLNSCSNRTNSNESLIPKTNEPSNIRLKNDSDHAFENVKVVFPSQEENFGNIESGEVTGYREVKIAYSYAYVEIFIENEKFVLQPIDYVGETTLGQGKFTYVLNVNLDERSVVLNLLEDK